MSRRITFQIKGMHCQSCAMLIKEELSTLPGVTDVVVDFKAGSGSLINTSNYVTDSKIIAIINNAGYQSSILP